ncbi:MAG: GDP-mannose 4,6-dehydratase [Myxococcales bacterium]|nr:GDP-mannose 4,6-dehydratase [Myxococcales bacterium]
MAIAGPICQPARMRVFVTGASGFVGRRLLPRLRAAGHEATGCDREVDVTQPEALRAALVRAEPDAVIHLAAMSDVALSWREPLRCYRINFVGTRTLLTEVARVRPAARVLLVGSADQYGPTSEAGSPFDETTPQRPRSPYARSKAAAEALGTQAAEQGLDVVRIRAFNHTGAGQSDQFVASSFARQVARIRLGRQEASLRVGNLDSVRDFLHVDDVLDAYVALLDPSVPAAVYNVAGERATPIRDVLDRLVALAGVAPRVEVDPDRFRPTDWLVGDASRLSRATGWRARTSLDELLRELHEHWLAVEGGEA